MFAERLAKSLSIRSSLLRVVVGSVVVGLTISLGMVAILRLLGLGVNPALASAPAAIGAALFAARMRIKD